MTVMVALVLRGIYLTDLTFIEDGTPRPPSFPCVVSRLLRARWLTHWLVHTGNPDGSLNYLINFKKRELVYDVIREIEQYQVRTTRIAPVRAARFIVFTHARTHTHHNTTAKGLRLPNGQLHLQRAQQPPDHHRTLRTSLAQERRLRAVLASSTDLCVRSFQDEEKLWALSLQREPRNTERASDLP
jgi:hypothetical protein